MNLLSVVCIGRNESKNIFNLSKSLEILKDNNYFSLQTIYVDSASEDGSADCARNKFDLVIELEYSEWLCAAAGRWAGTNYSLGNFILYLDADMELCHEFVTTIEQAFKTKGDNNNLIDGWIGRYIHTFPDSSKRWMGFASKEGPSDAIGGAVLLRRESVINAGNWLPFVFSMEEMELYSRLQNGKKSIQFVEIDMIKHHTEKNSKFHIVKSMLLPSGGYGKKFYGMGQIIHHRLKENNLLSFIKILPEPFLFFVTELSILAGLALASFSFSILIATSYLTWILLIRRKGISTLLTYISYSIQIIYGWTKYNPFFKPIVRESKISDSLARLS